MYLFKKLPVILLALSTIVVNAADNPKEKSNRIIVNVDLGKETISKFVYGHFTEHLGRCMYGGIYVGYNSPLPNRRGIRNDVVAALKEISPSVVRWPGGCYICHNCRILVEFKRESLRKNYNLFLFE